MTCYGHKNMHNNILRKSKQITSDLLFTCGTAISELTGNNKDLSQFHGGSKRKLITDINCYPICSLCKR